MKTLPNAMLLEEEDNASGFATILAEGPILHADASMALLQFRRHTRILLQQIVSMIANSAALKTTPNGTNLANNLISRICLAADIHDSLMGCQHLDGIRFRLETLAKGIVKIFCNSETRYQVMAASQAAVPVRMHDTLLQITFELVRSIVLAEPQASGFNRIDIDLTHAAGRTLILKVSTDQKGLAAKHSFNESMTFVRQLASSNNADLEINSNIGFAAQIIFRREG